MLSALAPAASRVRWVLVLTSLDPFTHRYFYCQSRDGCPGGSLIDTRLLFGIDTRLLLPQTVWCAPVLPTVLSRARCDKKWFLFPPTHGVTGVVQC